MARRARFWPALARRVPVLAHKNFRLLLADRLLAPMAFSFSLVGVSFAVLDSTRSAAHPDGSTPDLSYVLAAQIAPALIVLLVGGVIADRIAPQRVIVAANVMIAAGEGTFGIWFLLGHLGVPAMILLEVITGSGMALFYPASQALLPRLVPADQMTKASAISRLAMNAATMAGAALAGECVALFGPGWALAVCGIGMLGTVPLLLAIRLAPLGVVPEARTLSTVPEARTLSTVPEARTLNTVPEARTLNTVPEARKSDTASPGGHAPNFLGELREGWSEFRSHTWLWVTVLQFTVVLAAWSGGFQVLGPAVAKAHLGGAQAWGLIAAAEAIGLIVGGIVSLRWTPGRPVLFVVLMGAAISLSPLSLAMLLPLSAILMTSFGLGVTLELMMVVWTVTMAARIPAAKLARVSAYDALGSMMGMPIGALAAGPIAGIVGISVTQYGAAAMILVASAFALVPRDVRTVRSAGVGPAAAADLAGPAPDSPAELAEPAPGGLGELPVPLLAGSARH